MKTKTFSIFFLVLFTLALTVGTGLASFSTATLTVKTCGTTVSFSWTSVAGATGYTLYYAPSPYTGPDTIGSIPMGTQTSWSATLWEGAAYFVAVQAYSNNEESELSNIESFSIYDTDIAKAGYARLRTNIPL